MNTQREVGLGLVVAGVAAYVAGIFVAYPGRSFSITVVIVGIAVAAVSRPSATEDAV